MKLIPLTQGKFAQVDDEDYDELIKYKWQLKISNSVRFYAHRGTYKETGAKGSRISMHRQIMKIIDSKVWVDHKDHNGLNNQKNNLRIATPVENARNRKSHSKSTSKFLGVSGSQHSWKKDKTDKNSPTVFGKKTWTSVICVENNKIKRLGRFPKTPCGELLAAVSYDIAAEKYFGEFANLNFKSL